MNQDIVSVLSIAVAALFLLITLGSLITNTPAGSKSLKISVNPFQAWNRNQKPFPCVTDHENSSGGIYYVRIPRTSAKGVSVSKRIAGLEGRLLDLPAESCKVSADVAPMRAIHQEIDKRDKDNSFLWSIIRSPERRAISHFGLRLRNNEVEATTESFVNDLRTSVSYQPNVMLKFLSMEDTKSMQTEEEYAGLVQNILSEYNFIGVEERLRESLVALSMVIGTNVNHVVYDFSRCLSDDIPDWVTPEMALYLESEEWRQRQGGDYMLYSAVDKALDLTIQKLDKNEFNSRLATFDSIMTKWSEASSIIKGSPGCGAAFNGKHHADLIEWVNDLPERFRKQLIAN